MVLTDIEQDLIGPVEAELIRRYKPLWNSYIVVLVFIIRVQVVMVRHPPNGMYCIQVERG